MIFSITKPDNQLKGTIAVPASKSLSNRLLIINALSCKPVKLLNLSDSDDTQIVERALSENGEVVDAGHAGTAMRFLTAYLAATTKKTVIITGTERMKNRPIGQLVEALRKLGADVRYDQKEGFPPLQIFPSNVQGGTLEIDGSVSSQFISALMMIGPLLEKGLELHLKNEVISSSYIQMTAGLMHEFGVETDIQDRVITIAPQSYSGTDVTVEGDWSGVSYWYQMAAFAEDADLYIEGLKPLSYQGDSKVKELFEPLGVATTFTETGIHLSKTSVYSSIYKFNFIENPDLVQTMAVTLVMMGIPFEFDGTQSLRIKETDRITALQTELEKFGAWLEYDGKGKLTWNGKRDVNLKRSYRIATYHDHRMALAFAPIALLGPKIKIEDPGVVAKSYPGFWDDLRQLDFEVEELD